MAKGKRKSRSMKTKERGPRAIKTKLTKRQLVDHIVTHAKLDDSDLDLSTRDARRIVTNVLDGLGDAMERSVAPRGIGTFALPGLFKVSLRERKAIKPGTMVRNPATGEMRPSKGRPASKRVKINALKRLRQAATGE